MVAYIDPDIYLYVIPFMINKDPVRKKVFLNGIEE